MEVSRLLNGDDLMITLRRNIARHHLQDGEQDIWRTFFPPDHPGLVADGFGNLISLNEIRISPGYNVASNLGDYEEIVTYVYQGSIAHKDSTGDSGFIHAGEFQLRSTGRNIRYQDTNASQTKWAHIFQVSIRPSKVGIDHAHKQRRFTVAERRDMLCAIVSPDGRNGSLRIHQDALVYSSVLLRGMHLVHGLSPGRSAWLHVVCGEVTINGILLTQGDGIGLSIEPSVSLTVLEDSEIILTDLPPVSSSF